MEAAIALGDVAEPTPIAPVAADGLAVVDRAAAYVPATLWPHWQALADEAAEPNPFAEPWFVDAGLRAFAKGEARLVEVWNCGRLDGVIALCVGADYGRMRVPHVTSWRHHHDFLGVPVIRAGQEAPFWGALLDHLDRAEWAVGLFHAIGLVENGAAHRGFAAAAKARGRAALVVHRTIRAALESDLAPAAYYEATVRKKKRKELKRLHNRLAELGQLTTTRLDTGEDPALWTAAFLRLERSGWKGTAGSALACSAATDTFFRDAVAGAAAAGRLQFVRIDLNGRPIAMLVNFLTAPGSFSFKIAFDEAYARFSPGVLIQIENLDILDRPEIAWMDSCAAEDHPMIDSLWGERRSIVRCTIRLSGAKRALTYGVCRSLETLSAARRRLLRKTAA